MVIPQSRKELLLGNLALESLKEAVVANKFTGTAKKNKQQAYNCVKKGALGRIAKKYKLTKVMATYLSIPREPQKNKLENVKVRKTRKDAISQDVKELVQNFFLLLEVSREIPCRKEVKDDSGKKVPVPKHTMIMTMKPAFELFKSPQYHSDVKIGFTSFRKLKPPQVRRLSETNRLTCLCQSAVTWH